MDGLIYSFSDGNFRLYGRQSSEFDFLSRRKEYEAVLSMVIYTCRIPPDSPRASWLALRCVRSAGRSVRCGYPSQISSPVDGTSSHHDAETTNLFTFGSDPDLLARRVRDWEERIAKTCIWRTCSLARYGNNLPADDEVWLASPTDDAETQESEEDWAAQLVFRDFDIRHRSLNKDNWWVANELKGMPVFRPVIVFRLCRRMLSS